MSPPAILDSPFLNLSVIDSLLSKPCSTEQRLQLLAARLHLLTNAITTTTTKSIKTSNTFQADTKNAQGRVKAGHDSDEFSSRDKNLLEELQTRLDLGIAYLDMIPPDYSSAELQLSMVESRSKGLLKRRKQQNSGANPTRGETVFGPDMQNLPGGGQETKSKGGETEDIAYWDTILKIRSKALERLIRVEEGLGRSNRAQRWREALQLMQNDLM